MLRIIIALMLMLLASPVAAWDLGQWENRSPQVRTWFQKLKARRAIHIVLRRSRRLLGRQL